MHSIAAVLLCSSLLAGADAGPLAGIVSLVEARKCEEAHLRLGATPLPKQPDSGTEKSGRALARVVGYCREKDPVIGFALSEKALAMAPADPAVQTAHAESLLALKQRGEAAALLDQTLKLHGADAPRARLLRGRLAVEEGDHDLAIRMLRPLKGDGEHGAEVERLLEESGKQLELRHSDKSELAWAEADAREKAQRAEEAIRNFKSQEGGTPGKLVASLKGKVGVGGERIYTAKGVKKGQSYVFSASGECARGKAPKKKKRGAQMIEDPTRDIFGIDFAVQIGQLPPARLAVGQTRIDRSEIPFVADDNNLTVRVFDRSSLERGVKCSVTDFVIRTP